LARIAGTGARLETNLEVGGRAALDGSGKTALAVKKEIFSGNVHL
jgi:hypothetical protein